MTNNSKALINNFIICVIQDDNELELRTIHYWIISITNTNNVIIELIDKNPLIKFNDFVYFTMNL